MLYQKLQAALPQGDLKTPIRVQRGRPCQQAFEETLGSTLGPDDPALVILDPGDFPKSWAIVDDFADAVGTMSVRVDNKKGDEERPLEATLCKDVTTTAQDLRSSNRVTLGDPHLDAKVFPHLHPWGSGSLYSENGSGGVQHLARARLLSLQDDFRSNPTWVFWMMDRILKNDLYFKQLQRAKKQKAHAAASFSNAATVPKTAASSKSEEQAKPAAAKRGLKRKAEEAHGDDKQALANTAKEDVYEKLFGRVEPRDIPESSAWWRQRAAELLAISEPHERGMFTGMVTITQNDASPELLANARRGPCAPPNESEMVEYLFTHKRSHQEKRPNITKDATAATLSYQMRAHAMKKNFLHQNRRTPLGHCTDYWDRTEAQRRHALHGHIPY